MSSQESTWRDGLTEQECFQKMIESLDIVERVDFESTEVHNAELQEECHRDDLRGCKH